MKDNKINKQGRKWFVFYVYIRPIIVVLFNIQIVLSYLNVYSDLPFYGQVYFIGVLLFIVFNLIIWFLALGESKRLISAISFLVLFEIFFIPFGSSMNENYSNSESVIIYVLLVIIFALCWLWPNYIYFRKREWIFQDDEDVTVCKNCNNKILKTEIICPCCKNEITNNNKIKEQEKTVFICSNCKAEVNKNSKSCPECGEVFEVEEESVQVKKSNKKTTDSDMDKKYSDLNKLKKLLDNDIITQEEFEKEKKKILNK